MNPILILGVTLILGGCVQATPPTHLAAPADPAVGTRPPHHATVTAGVRGYDVVEPLDWRELNRRVAPGAASERSERDDATQKGR